jgi:hypothetical protein
LLTLSTNNIDMSSTEMSGAPAEATATHQPADAPVAAASFGSTRGSGLARGKRSSNTPASATPAPTGEYKPTAIEVLNAPREYQNPFAPAPAPSEPSVVLSSPAVIPAEPVQEVAPAVAPVATAPLAPARETVREMFPLDEKSGEQDSVAESPDKSELNILPPERQKIVPAQTWESDGFQPAPARESRSDRPRREERSHRESLENAPIPEKFLYVRPGHTYVPTPSNYGGAPREERRPASIPAAAAPAPAQRKSGGFVGWLKSLFGGKAETPPAGADTEARQEEGPGRHRHRRHRGGRNHGGEQSQTQNAGGDGGFRRRRGGRGRGGQGGQGGQRSEHREGGSSGN